MKINRPVSPSPLPDSAKKVYQGKIFDVYEWQQKLYDGSFATFEKIKRKDSTGVIATTKQKTIIISKQEQPGGREFYGLFGGRVEDYQDPLTNAKQELLEESGLISNNWKYWFGIQPLGKIEWASYVFIAQNVVLQQKPEPEAGEKISQIEVDFPEFIEHLRNENWRDTEISLKVFQMQQKKDWRNDLAKLLFT